MALITESILLESFLALILIVYLIYRWCNSNKDYWDRRGVPFRNSGIFINLLLGRKSQFEQTIELYQSLEKEPFAGTFQFTKPTLIVKDPELIHRVLVKDFAHFHDRSQEKLSSDPLNESLFSMTGQTWRALRYKLTPTFSAGKIKGMFEQVSMCGDNMMEKIEKLENVEIDCKTILYEFTVNVISSCAFGLQFKPDTPEFDEFKSFVLKAFDGGPLVILKFGFLFLFPKLAEKLRLSIFSREAGDYFFNLTRATTKFRKENNVQRNDYFQLLLTLKEQEESGKDMGLTSLDISEEDAVVNQMKYTMENGQSSNVKLMTDEVICANSFSFLLAGSESVSSIISFILFELSRHQDIQQELQQEVSSVLTKHGGHWSYEAIKDMTFLDQIVQETQRLYPGMAEISRECVQPYQVPNSNLVLEKGVFISIPVMGLHMDPQYYPEPENFKPERFKGNNFKPNPTYLPFGNGPRICIAVRFAVMEVKTCVSRIMSQYTVKLSPKTQLPLKFDPRSIFGVPKGGIWLSFEKRKT